LLNIGGKVGNIKAIGYVRVSTLKQEISVDMQTKKIKQYAELNDLELQDIIIDHGKSAKNLKRPGAKKLLSLVKSHKIDTVIIYKLDRLTRSLKDLNNLIELFNKNDVSLASIKDSLDTRTANGRMVINLLGTISQWEREVIGERTSEALQELKASGKRYGNIAPFGKQYVNGRILPNILEQEILNTIEDLKAQGCSYTKIANELTMEGYTTRKGTQYTKNSVYKIAGSVY